MIVNIILIAQYVFQMDHFKVFNVTTTTTQKKFQREKVNINHIYNNVVEKNSLSSGEKETRMSLNGTTV